MTVTAEDIAGAMLGEEPEAPAETQPETAEEVEATAAPVVEEPETVQEVAPEPEEEQKVPLKALQEERRKRQEYEQKLKEFEVRQTPKTEQTLEDMFLADPKGTLGQINAEIERLASDDPYANAANIEKLRDLKIELRERGNQRINTEQSRFVQELNNAVPDFPKKIQVLSDYAQNEMGLSQDTIQRLSNPGLVGPQAALDFIKSVARQHEASQAKVTVKAKAVTPTPTKVEAPGSGTGKSSESIETLRKNASKSDADRVKYFEAIGAL